MPRICHLLDRSASWEQRVGVGTLLERSDSGSYPQFVALLDPASRRMLQPKGTLPHTLHPLGPVDALAAPAISRLVEGERAGVIHAWGLHAATAARAATDKPLVVELSDPAVVHDHIKRIRTLSESAKTAWVCSSGIVRRRLIEGGVAADRCVVIRPGVDFATVNRIRRGSLREELGVPGDQTLVVVPEPVLREHGAFEAFSAAALCNHLSGKVRVIVPGRSREAQRIARYARTIPSRPTILATLDRYPFEELLCISDVLVFAALGDVSTTAIAWAMAANVAVIGSAVPAIAELISHKVNGQLYNPKAECGVIPSIAKLLEDTLTQARLKEPARGQAYEVFGLRRFVDQHRKVYENLLCDAVPDEGIADSARIA